MQGLPMEDPAFVFLVLSEYFKKNTAMILLLPSDGELLPRLKCVYSVIKNIFGDCTREKTSSNL
jgi:hypothetical protein